MKEARVSRSFIYSRPELRAKIPAAGPRRAAASDATRDYDLPRIASLQTRLQQANAELLAVRKRLRATERALAAAGATDARLASDSELEEVKSEAGRLSVEMTAARDHAARMEALMADKEADYQAARENARGYLKELTILRGELAETRRALARRGTLMEKAR